MSSISPLSWSSITQTYVYFFKQQEEMLLRSQAILTILSSGPPVTHGRKLQHLILGKQRWKERKVFQLLCYGDSALYFRTT